MDYTIICDGGCNGNPGQMYGSYQIAMQDGRKRIERHKFYHGTNNQAEYLSLIAALEDIILKCHRASIPVNRFGVAIFSDSQLVVGHLAEGWGCYNSELMELRDQTLAHLGCFREWSITWWPRQEIVKVLGH